MPASTSAGNAFRVRVRPYRPADRADVLALAPMLAVGIAPWLDRGAFVRVAREWIVGSIAGIGSEQAIFVAEDEEGLPAGFVSVCGQAHFTGARQAYIGELAVTEAAEGHGIGRSLVAAAEE